MSETSAYSLRWCGKQSGPYTIQEINRKLDEHEIGMGHEVQYQNKWISVEEFLTALKSASADADEAARPPVSQPAASTPQRSARVAGPESSPVASTTAEPRRSTPASQPPPRLEGRSYEAEAAAGRPRNRIIYATLAILLGFAGAHNFYARHWMTGLFQLILSLTTYLLGFGIIATWVWALVEAVVIRKDGYGTEMR